MTAYPPGSSAGALGITVSPSDPALDTTLMVRTSGAAPGALVTLSASQLDEHGRTWGTPGAPARLPTIRDGVAQKAWLCGPPDQIIDDLMMYQAKYPGLDHVLVHWAEGMPPAEFKEQLRTFAREVMPAFPSAQLAGAPL